MRIIRVDHTGPEPVLVVDFGDREERWSMDRARAAAVGAPAWLRDWVNKTTREEEAAYTRRHGGWFGDAEQPPALTRVNPEAHPPGGTPPAAKPISLQAPPRAGPLPVVGG